MRLPPVLNEPQLAFVDPIDARPGFSSALAKIAGNGVRTIIVETANRFARNLMVQEVGFAKLCELGIILVAADIRACHQAPAADQTDASAANADAGSVAAAAI